MNEARKKVRANKRSAGIEGITIDDLDSYIKKTGGGYKDPDKKQEI